MTQGLSGIKQDNGCESPFVNLENALFLFWGVFWEDWVLFFFWLFLVFVAVCKLSLVVVSGGYSLLRRSGFSLWWLLLLFQVHGLSGPGTRA